MRESEKQDAMHEALEVLNCLKDLVCAGPDELNIRATGLYFMLDLIIDRLKLASS